MIRQYYLNRCLFLALIVLTMFASAASRAEQPKGWRAIVAFTSTEAVSEDWNWFYEDIRKAAHGMKDANIQVIYAGPNDRLVVIGPADAPLATIDIGEYFAHGKGYLFMENGRDIRYQPYGQSADTLREASDYFGIRLGQ